MRLGAGDSAHAYPTPIQLARLRAERAQRAGQASPVLWGSVGGLTTLGRHGAGHYRKLAARRWGRA